MEQAQTDACTNSGRVLPTWIFQAFQRTMGRIGCPALAPSPPDLGSQGRAVSEPVHSHGMHAHHGGPRPPSPGLPLVIPGSNPALKRFGQYNAAFASPTQLRLTPPEVGTVNGRRVRRIPCSCQLCSKSDCRDDRHHVFHPLPVAWGPHLELHPQRSHHRHAAVVACTGWDSST